MGIVIIPSTTSGALIYQLVHPWHWLTYGQNANALGSLAAGIAAGAATLAGVYAVRAYRSTVEQLNVARTQDVRDLSHHLEVLRPQLSIEIDERRPPKNGGTFVRIRNIGTGRAVEIKRVGISLTTSISQPAGSDYLAIVQMTGDHPNGPGHHTAFLWYSSTDGRRFRTETFFINPETVGGEMAVEITTGDEPTLLHHLQMAAFEKNGSVGVRPSPITDPQQSTSNT